MPTWPASLMPYPLVTGYQESAPVTAIRTEMDTGIAKQRQRYTATPRRVTGAVTLPSKADLDTLYTFFTTTLSGGSLSFDWVDRNGAPCVYRFIVGPDALRWEPLDPERWLAHLQLEIMP
jgi:hypothetical protein